MFKNLIQLMKMGFSQKYFDMRSQNAVEKYLASSTDLVELERRQKELQRKGIY